MDNIERLKNSLEALESCIEAYSMEYGIMNEQEVYVHVDNHFEVRAFNKADIQYDREDDSYFEVSDDILLQSGINGLLIDVNFPMHYGTPASGLVILKFCDYYKINKLFVDVIHSLSRLTIT